MFRLICTISGDFLVLWMEAVMPLAPQISVSSSANMKLKTIRDLIDFGKYAE
jgi:hypothetical protein